MEMTHTKECVTPARTAMRFSKGELIGALTAHVESTGGHIPNGKIGIWFPHDLDDEKITTLFIDHEEPTP